MELLFIHQNQIRQAIQQLNKLKFENSSNLPNIQSLTLDYSIGDKKIKLKDNQAKIKQYKPSQFLYFEDGQDNIFKHQTSVNNQEINETCQHLVQLLHIIERSRILSLTIDLSNNQLITDDCLASLAKVVAILPNLSDIHLKLNRCPKLVCREIMQIFIAKQKYNNEGHNEIGQEYSKKQCLEEDVGFSEIEMQFNKCPSVNPDNNLLLQMTAILNNSVNRLESFKIHFQENKIPPPQNQAIKQQKQLNTYDEFIKSVAQCGKNLLYQLKFNFSTCVTLTSENIFTLAHGLQSCTSLQYFHLNLEKLWNLSDDHFQAIVEAVLNMRYLTNLTLKFGGSTKLTNQPIQFFALNFVIRIPYIRKLKLDFSNCDSLTNAIPILLHQQAVRSAVLDEIQINFTKCKQININCSQQCQFFIAKRRRYISWALGLLLAIDLRLFKMNFARSRYLTVDIYERMHVNVKSFLL